MEMSNDPLARLLLAIIAACAVALTVAQFSGRAEPRGSGPAKEHQAAQGPGPTFDAATENEYYKRRYQIFPVKVEPGKTHILRTDQWTGEVDIWVLRGPAGWQQLHGTRDEAAVAEEEARAALAAATEKAAEEAEQEAAADATP